jgi:hypothetical protein
MIMSELAIDMMNTEDDVLQFECWYHSVMDDVASLIRANGYDKIMFDIQCAVERMENKE